MAASALLLAVAACSNDDEPGVPSYDANPNAVRIQPSVSGIVVTRTTPADDTQSTQFNKDDKIQVSRDGTTFFEYTFDGNNWSPTSGSTSYLMWGADETEIDLQAYYPASASMNSFTLPQNQSDINTDDGNPYKIADADYMTYSGPVTKGANNTASFAMQRRTARIRVTIDGFGDQYDAGSTCNVKIYSPYATVSVNYSGDTPAVTGSGSAQLVTPLNGGGMTTGSTATALIVPSSTEMPDANFMEVTINSETLYVKGIPAHAAGYSYDYHLTVGKDGIVINSVQVNPWNDETVEGGTAEEWISGPDASINTIKASEAGQIASNPAWITTAIGEGNNLTIFGKINDADLAAIKSWLDDNSDKTLELNLADTDLKAFQSSCFSGCSNLTGITLPKSLTDLGRAAFARTGLTTVDIPASVTTLQEAFNRCSNLKEIHIRGTVYYCYTVCFQCTALTDIYFYKTTTPPGVSSQLIFDGVDKNNLKVHLPQNANIADWCSADKWNLLSESNYVTDL